MKRFVVAGAAAAAVAGVIYLMVPRTEAEAQLPEVKTAAVTRVAKGNIASSITLSAEFRPYQETDLHAKVAGYLKDITVDIGDQVKEGQVIATLDSEELKADYNRAQADFHNAQLDYNRVSEVVRRRPGLLAQADVDKAQATFEIAKANMERAKAFYNYATITVPFNGVVTKRYVDPGAMIQASTSSSTQAQPIVHIADNTRLRLDFPVPESAVPLVHTGTPVRLTMQATGQVIEAAVVRSAGKIDSATRTMQTEVDVENENLRITPGMYASAIIELEQKSAALTLPVQAVALGDKPNVWVVDGNHHIEERAVALGLQAADRVEVLDGVKEGEMVVFGSRAALNTGMEVAPKILADPDTGRKLAQGGL